MTRPRYYQVSVNLEIGEIKTNNDANITGGDLDNGRDLSQPCTVCHGVDGKAASGGNSALVPNIFAQNKDYLIVKLKEYKSGKINHPQMSLIAQMLTEDQILNVSEWYSMISVELKLPE